MSNSLRAALARAINRDDEVRVNLVLSPSLEASFDTLNGIDGVYFQRLGLETQQIDAHITKIVEQAIEEAINPPPSPTIPTVYAVGVKALQEGNLGEQSTLRAAVQDRIENNSEVILALLPAETAADVRAQQEAEASASDEEEPKLVSDNSGIIDAAKQFVGSVEIPVVESLEALQEHLKRYEAQPAVELVTSQEGIFDALKRFFSSNKKSPKKPALDSADDIRNELTLAQDVIVDRLLSDAKSIKELALREGTIDGRWISQDLLGGKTTPDNVILALNRHLDLLRDLRSGAARGVQVQLKFMQDNATAVKNSEDSFATLNDLVKKVGFKNLSPLKLTEQELRGKALPATSCYWEQNYQSWLYLDEPDNIEVPRLPALNHAQITAFGKALPGIVAKLDKISNIDVNDSVLWGPYEGDRAPLEIYWEACNDSDSPLEWLFDAKNVTEWGWVQVLYTFEHRVEKAIEAIYKWIYHSIASNDSSETP